MSKTHLALILLVANHITGALSRGPPVITAPIQPRFTGKLGEVIRFICPIRGDPEPIFEWYRDGERVMEYWDRYRLISKGYSLNIQRLECEDQGTYICKAVNGFGVHEISFQLDLLDDAMQDACKSSSDEDDTSSSKPIILHKFKKSKHMLKPAGNYALLKCIAVAEPLPKFHWFKDGVEIIPEKGPPTGNVGLKYVVRSTVLSEDDLTEVSEMEGMRSTLQISDLRGSDTANYTCRAQNEHGWDELTHILEVVERQVPRRPELHPDFPPVHTWVEAGQAGSLSCKVNSEFPPEVHWLKRLTPSSGVSNVVQPPVPDEAEVETIHPQFIANRTIIIGNIKYQILPSAPAKLITSDGYYASILLLSKKSQEVDSGYYVCLALNNAGFNFRQVYFNVTNSYVTPYQTTDDSYPGRNTSEGWGDKGRTDATTMAVVIVVVVFGLVAMVASCFVWKRRKNHLRDKTLSVAAPSLCCSAPEAIVVQQPTPVTHSPCSLDYSVFREGLSSGNGTPPASNSSRSDPPQNAPLQPHVHQQKDLVPPRMYYLPARTPNSNSPRQQKVMHQQQQQRAKQSSGSGRSGSGSRQHHRSSPRSSNNHHHHYYVNPPYHHQRHPVPPEARSLTTDTSFHSESFYPDWSAHPHHIRLPYPSPESSFDQL
ncbi:hypothetical protein OUZ56_015369 [Daphnia magna]|uniref:Ig-like domain-containing protein n=1 Tax=Daphnia magna TaxID=35525 RepID=A0ABR0AMM5_9CRUS|nr:hypothetical protein OUZ56_015369 [Daphnia magna]